MSVKVISFAGKLELNPKEYKQSVSNPHYFNGHVRNTFDYVYAPNHPHIEAAYNKASTPTLPEGVLGLPVSTVEAVSTPTPSATITEAEKAPESAYVKPESYSDDVVVEEDTQFEDDGEKHWSELSWPKMRSLAAKHSAEPVRNREMAVTILTEAEAQGILDK